MVLLQCPLTSAPGYTHVCTTHAPARIPPGTIILLRTAVETYVDYVVSAALFGPFSLENPVQERQLYRDEFVADTRPMPSVLGFRQRKSFLPPDRPAPVLLRRQNVVCSVRRRGNNK